MMTEFSFLSKLIPTPTKNKVSYSGKSNTKQFLQIPLTAHISKSLSKGVKDI